MTGLTARISSEALACVGWPNRIGALGGALDVDSRRGAGTTIRATIPCGRSARSQVERGLGRRTLSRAAGRDARGLVGHLGVHRRPRGVVQTVRAVALVHGKQRF